MAQNAEMPNGSKQPFCRGHNCLWESIEQNHYYIRTLAFKSMKILVIKDF
jgi:hypothetical protein